MDMKFEISQVGSSESQVSHVDLQYRPCKKEEWANSSHEALSFMDGSSGYNQIHMASVDEELMAFHTPKGIYCYKVMPFGLKLLVPHIKGQCKASLMTCFTRMSNATLMTLKREDHLHDLRNIFERLRRYQLKMNPSKCAFGVTSGKFL
ncbi:UNVERIFIED_CONTAM: hypothetical protein Scaly_0079900 [Sesamum calycinum]|uniref:Reverse transcriptase domain-containing protein n=1 Tax=Sesamum calycinum TaxID=2727403 RepID=A0AAW2SW14_9LAMI